MITAIYEALLWTTSSLTASIVTKATIFLAVGLTAASMARNSRAAMRHALLASMYAVLLALPVVSMIAPPLRWVIPAAPLPPQAAQSFSETTQTIPAAPQPGVPVPAPRWALSPSALLYTGWIGGLALSLTPLLMGLWQVARLRRASLPWFHGQALADELARGAGIRRRIDVRLHRHLTGPMTCGALHPSILLPDEAQSWDSDNLNRAIVHELEHVRRGDWAVQSLARVVCALYWFHPLVWIAWRRLVLEAERSCDDAVLGCSEATAYADQLVALARRFSSSARSPLVAMVNRSDLSTRIGAVLDLGQRRGRAGRLPVAIACAASALLVLTISPFRMVAASASPAPALEPFPSATEFASQDATAAGEPGDEDPPQKAPPPVATPPPAQRLVWREFSQTSGPWSQFATRSSLVVVPVVVTDSSGKSIEGLGPKDFAITEDGVEQEIRNFEYQKLAAPAPGTDTPTTYYTLGYYPSNATADGQFRKIQVIDRNDSTATLKHRPGYYANKPTRFIGTFEPTPVPGSTPPILLSKRDPEYSTEARQAKYQGTVTLSVEVTETGEVTNVTVLQHLGLGLDEKAIEAVKQWRFKPGTIHGQPSPMQTQVSVNFRLL